MQIRRPISSNAPILLLREIARRHTWCCVHWLWWLWRVIAARVCSNRNTHGCTLRHRCSTNTQSSLRLGRNILLLPLRSPKRCRTQESRVLVSESPFQPSPDFLPEAHLLPLFGENLLLFRRLLCVATFQTAEEETGPWDEDQGPGDWETTAGRAAAGEVTETEPGFDHTSDEEEPDPGADGDWDECPVVQTAILNAC